MQEYAWEARGGHGLAVAQRPGGCMCCTCVRGAGVCPVVLLNKPQWGCLQIPVKKPQDLLPKIDWKKRMSVLCPFGSVVCMAGGRRGRVLVM